MLGCGAVLRRGSANGHAHFTIDVDTRWVFLWTLLFPVLQRCWLAAVLIYIIFKEAITKTTWISVNVVKQYQSNQLPENFLLKKPNLKPHGWDPNPTMFKLNLNYYKIRRLFHCFNYRLNKAPVNTKMSHFNNAPDMDSCSKSPLQCFITPRQVIIS